MNAPLEQLPFGLPVEADVHRVEAEHLVVDVDGRTLEATRLAGVEVSAGARVLIVRGAAGRHYATGVVRHAEGAATVLALSDGARIERAGQQVRFVAADGKALFEYDTEGGASTVHLRDDLRLEADGVLTLAGAGGVTIESESAVDVRAEGLNVATQTVDATVDAVRSRVRLLLTRADHAKAVVDVLETTAGRIVERAKDTLRETEGLTQIRAGRLRWVAQRALHTLAERTIVVSKGDTKLKANRVHLG